MGIAREPLLLNEAAERAETLQTGDTLKIPVTLQAPTGDETAWELEFTINKATSGDATGLKLVGIETSAPGTVTVIELFKGVVSKYSVDSDGNVVAAGSFTCAGFTSTGIDDNADQTVLTLGADESATFASNVGVGAAPSTRLHVFGSTSGARAWIEQSSSGSVNLGDRGQLLLTANAMNSVSKYSTELSFGSTDSNFTTRNPKVLATIVGYATEYYSADTDSGMGLAFATTPDDAGASPTPTVNMTLDQAGNLNVANGNIEIGTSGKGIDFSATPDAPGSESELFDDYEEGYHSPDVTCFNSGGYNLDPAGDTIAYTKTGRKVHLHGGIHVTSESGTPSGLIQVSIPYQVAALSDLADYVHVPVVIRDHGGTIVSAVARYYANQTVITLHAVSDTGVVSNISSALVDTDWFLDINFEYLTE